MKVSESDVVLFWCVFTLNPRTKSKQYSSKSLITLEVTLMLTRFCPFTNQRKPLPAVREVFDYKIVLHEQRASRSTWAPAADRPDWQGQGDRVYIEMRTTPAWGC